MPKKKVVRATSRTFLGKTDFSPLIFIFPIWGYQTVKMRKELPVLNANRSSPAGIAPGQTAMQHFHSGQFKVQSLENKKTKKVPQ